MAAFAEQNDSTNRHRTAAASAFALMQSTTLFGRPDNGRVLFKARRVPRLPRASGLPFTFLREDPLVDPHRVPAPVPGNHPEQHPDPQGDG